MIKKPIYLFFIFILAAAGNAFTQDSHELQAGSFLTGNLHSGDVVLYVVIAAESGILTVETTGNTDTFLEVYDEQENFLREDDDGGEGLNAKIEIIVTAGKTYYFYLSGYDDYISGPYRILASIRPLPAMTDLRIGTSLSGNLQSGGEIWYRVRPPQAGILTVETAGNIDTLLEVYDEQFTLLDEDDDSGEGFNAKIEISVLPGRTYYFRLSGYGLSGGAFRITAGYRASSAPVILRFGSSYSGNISSGGEYWYSARSTDNGLIIVETAGNTDTFLEAYDENYRLITFDDDSGEGLNARIEIEAAANTTYLFKLRGYSRNTAGPFRISASFE